MVAIPKIRNNYCLLMKIFFVQLVGYMGSVDRVSFCVVWVVNKFID